MDESKTPEKTENEGTNQSKEFQNDEVSIKKYLQKTLIITNNSQKKYYQ